MLGFLPAPLVGATALLLICLNTILWCLPLYVIAAVRWLAPARSKRPLTLAMSAIATCWIACNNLVISLTQRLSLEVSGLEGLDRHSWYLVTCNHQSWSDILILQRVFINRIPMLKFFIKRELIWVPVLGIAWWALDFPFMKRDAGRQASRAGLRNSDLDTTAAACELFKICPVSVLNFLEGTRVTAEKQQRQRSPFKHLLKPKSGGAAMVLRAMDQQIDTMIDVTLVYPNGVQGFWGFLCGRVGRVIVQVDRIEVPRLAQSGDYLEDQEFKRRFQEWIGEIWTAKDARIEAILDRERAAAMSASV